MDHKELNSSSSLICHCKNSIKLRILEIINQENKPIAIDEITEQIFGIVKKENSQIEIDDSFLKTYIRCIISEMAESKLLKFYILNIGENLETISFYYASISNELIDNKKSISKTVNKDEQKETKENPIELSFEKILRHNKESCEIKDRRNDPEFKNKLMDEIILLRKKIEKLKKENPNKKLHEEIHKYNELKDMGQEFLGYIANSKGLRIKDLYDELSISDDDK